MEDSIPNPTTESIVQRLEAANAAYRAGNPVLSDTEYDQLMAQLVAIDPGHPYLHRVEPEPEALFSARKVRHVTPMLSTEKAYTVEALRAFFDRVQAVAVAQGKTPVTYRATAKLDGLAGRHDGLGLLSTRGNGLEGQDISADIARGLFLEYPDRPGDGEIVIDQRFFQEHLQGRTFNGRELTHPRNFMVGFVGADEPGPHHQLAAEARAARFVLYSTLPAVEGPADYFLEHIAEISRRLRDDCPYLTDGIVIDVVDTHLREALGSTTHHHRWQIAYKTKGETADTRVRHVTWQVGRTGRVTPVLELEPVVLSVATIRRATAHTAAMVRSTGLGTGARIRIIRSGEVIPKVEAVLQPASEVTLPDRCPCCSAELEWEGEYLICPAGVACPDQAVEALQHFARTLEIRGIGEKVAERLVAAGFSDLGQLFTLHAADFQDMGITPGIAQNLFNEIQDRCRTPVDDWRLLAAFGIRHLGLGDARNLLKSVAFAELGTLTPERILEIPGFGPTTSSAIVRDISRLWGTISSVAQALTLRESRTEGVPESSSPIAGKRVVFTGTFSVDRKTLEQQAKDLGAQVQSAVTAKTDWLVRGDKPGTSKVTAAAKHGTTVLTEEAYRWILNRP